MASKTNIALMALGHLKVNTQITDIDTSTSNEAGVVLTYLETALDAMIEEYAPPWAENYVNLTLVATNPNDLWNYAYRYPTDCATSLDIVDTGRAGSTQDRGEIVYRLGSDASGKLIYTDYGPTATLRYVRKQDDTGTLGWRYEDMPASWSKALSYSLAALCAGSLSNKASSDFLERKYEFFVRKAAAITLNEQGYDEMPDSAAVRAR